MKKGVVAIDSLEHAQSVLKSLRATSNSQRRYQRSAVRDDHIVENLAMFDKLVLEKANEAMVKVSKEMKAQDLLASGQQQQPLSKPVIVSKSLESPYELSPKKEAAMYMTKSKMRYDEEDEEDDWNSDEDEHKEFGATRSTGNNSPKKKALLSSSNSSSIIKGGGGVRVALNRPARSQHQHLQGASDSDSPPRSLPSDMEGRDFFRSSNKGDDSDADDEDGGGGARASTSKYTLSIDQIEAAVATNRKSMQPSMRSPKSGKAMMLQSTSSDYLHGVRKDLLDVNDEDRRYDDEDKELLKGFTAPVNSFSSAPAAEGASVVSSVQLSRPAVPSKGSSSSKTDVLKELNARGVVVNGKGAVFVRASGRKK